MDGPPTSRIWQAGKRRCSASLPTRRSAAVMATQRQRQTHPDRFCDRVPDVFEPMISSGARRWPAITKKPTLLAARPQFQAFEPGCDIEADLTLHAERLQRN